MTQYLAFKNDQKEAENQPDFRVYKKDANGDIIKKTIEWKGEQKEVWADIGAVWCKIENGALKSMSIKINDVQAPEIQMAVGSPQNNNGQTMSDVQIEKAFEDKLTTPAIPGIKYTTNEINPDDIPF